MIKTVLIPSTGSVADEPVFRTAAQVARAFGAHLDFLHVRVDPVEVASAMMSADVGAGFAATDWIDRLERDAAMRAEKAKSAFDRFAATEKIVTAAPDAPAGSIAASYHVETGREADWMVRYGQTADLIVIGRRADENGVAIDTLETVLIESGRPLLIPGTAPLVSPLSRIAIAWKPTREAAHAVAAATPLLLSAKKVSILTVAEGGPNDAASASRLERSLRRHGLDVDVIAGPSGSDNPADALLSLARQNGAGLLVMGGYGHSRLREWVFGGFTEHILRGADLPVLMAH